MSKSKCIVPGCNDYTFKRQRLPFPMKAIGKFCLWLKVCGRRDLLNLDPVKVYNKSRICKKHFSKKCFLPNTEKLKSDAVPDSHLPESDNEFSIITDVEDNDGKSDTFIPKNNKWNEIIEYAAEEYRSNFERGHTDLQTCNITPSTSTSSDEWKSLIEHASKMFILEHMESDCIAASEDRISSPTTTEAQTSSKKDDAICVTRISKSRPKCVNINYPKISNRKLSAQRRSILCEMGVQGVKDLSPEAQKLFKMNQSLRKTVLRSTRKIAHFKKQMSNRASDSFFIGGKKNISFKSQIRLTGMKKQGHRFTLDDKLFSLQILKRSGRAYRFLSKVFILPTQRTVQRFFSNVILKVGINESMFQYLSNILLKKLKMSSSFGNAALMFDEMALCPHLDYNEKEDYIEGFQDLGDGRRSQKFADKALVFMVRGLVRKYKQPISYYFTAGTLNSTDLAVLIRTNISKLMECGFSVAVTICDQASSNSSAINKLCEETKAELLRAEDEYLGDYFTVNNEKIIPLFDPPHLLKGIRNTLLKKDIQFTLEGKVYKASWDHLIQVYHSDNGRYRVAPRLTSQHVIAQDMKKMKVKLAAQVFSYSVATALDVKIREGVLQPSAEGTREFIWMMDQVFDSVNGSCTSPDKGKVIRSAVRVGSPHIQFWNKAIKFFDSMYVVGVNGKLFKTPSIKNWARTLRNFKDVWATAVERGNRFLPTRNLNQDPVENKFGAIRSYGFRNNMPTPYHFMCTYKALLLNDLTGSHSIGSNCEADDCPILDNLRNFLVKSNINSPPKTSTNNNIIISDEEERGTVLPQGGYSSSITSSYVSGFILRKVGINCKYCIRLQHSEVIQSDHDLINMRERAERRRLKYPSSAFTNICTCTADLLMKLLPKYCHIVGIGSFLRNYVSNAIDCSDISCPDHENIFKQKFVKYIVKFILNNWVNRTNRYLEGKDRRTPFNHDPIHLAAFEHYNKRLKNK